MDAITPLLLLCFTLAVGCGTALNAPAWQASVRLQVGHAHLPQAIALNTIAFNLARSVGPALGGLLISITGPAAGFGLNALSYVALIVVLLRWHRSEEHTSELQSLMRISYAVFCLKKQNNN